ncbi:uncharacterized protein PAE49_017037 [Odontesthes bonariensis]|uniref:uncharacterized protein LOC142399938 n=1 Tax=Odontesthes bonariensis TaxID=219752 RepID=UPI003F58B3E6
MSRTLTLCCWLLLGLVATLMFLCPPAAAASLHCNVTQLPNGTFRFQLCEPPGCFGCPGCSGCTASWEDTHGVVISRDSIFNKSLVESLTDQHIDLKTCHDHLHYTRECCETHPVEADCTVNCSNFTPKDRPPLRFCASKTLCFDGLTGGLLIGGPVAAIVLVLGVVWAVCACRRRRRRRRSAALYSAPTEQIHVEKCQFSREENAPDG